MTTQELIDYYANLLILQYKGKTKAYATIQTLVTPVIMDQLPIAVQNAFNLTGDAIAEGVQLDILGKYAGVTRSGYGFQGQPITLNDADFLSLIHLAILRNTADASLYTIQRVLQLFFTPGSIFVIDYKNMQMSYLVDSDLGSQDFLQLFVTEGLMLRPLGVSIPLIIYGPIIDTFFGFVTYEIPTQINNTPFNSYEDYQMDRPWLRYEDAIII